MPSTWLTLQQYSLLVDCYPQSLAHSVNVCGQNEWIKMPSLGYSIPTIVSQLGYSLVKILIHSALRAAKAPAGCSWLQAAASKVWHTNILLSGCPDVKTVWAALIEISWQVVRIKQEVQTPGPGEFYGWVAKRILTPEPRAEALVRSVLRQTQSKCCQ